MIIGAVERVHNIGPISTDGPTKDRSSTDNFVGASINQEAGSKVFRLNPIKYLSQDQNRPSWSVKSLTHKPEGVVMAWIDWKELLASLTKEPEQEEQPDEDTNRMTEGEP